jgi:hypothetical protein
MVSALSSSSRSAPFHPRGRDSRKRFCIPFAQGAIRQAGDRARRVFFILLLASKEIQQHIVDFIDPRRLVEGNECVLAAQLFKGFLRFFFLRYKLGLLRRKVSITERCSKKLWMRSSYAL